MQVLYNYVNNGETMLEYIRYLSSAAWSLVQNHLGQKNFANCLNSIGTYRIRPSLSLIKVTYIYPPPPSPSLYIWVTTVRAYSLSQLSILPPPLYFRVCLWRQLVSTSPPSSSSQSSNQLLTDCTQYAASSWPPRDTRRRLRTRS